MICDFQLRPHSVAMKPRYCSHIKSCLHSSHCLPVHLSSFVTLIYLSRVLNGDHFLKTCSWRFPVCFLNENKGRCILLMTVTFICFPLPGGIILFQCSFFVVWLWRSHVERKSRSAESSCTALITEVLRFWGNKSNLCRGKWGVRGLSDFTAGEECVNLCSLSHYSG